jgi:flagellar basal-body rod modification protein FlgD
MATSFDTTLADLGITRSAATSAPVGRSRDASEMTSGDFIKLMTAQMKNQDPFEPMDNSQMVAQMAQFSSLSSQSEMATTLKSIATKLGAATTSDALGFVGKTVLIEGAAAYPRAGGGFAGAVELGGAASAVHLTIARANGDVVRTVGLGAHAAGTLSYDWDGTDDAGEATGNGPFTVTAHARDGAKTVAARTLVWAPVTSVSMPSGAAPVLTLPGIGQVATTAVRAIA